MGGSAQATMLSRILRVGLGLALLGQVAWSFRPTPTQAQSDLEVEGRRLYETNCSTCHGLDAQGTELGPSLQGVGPASIDLQLSTGRMPLAYPDAQPQRTEPKFDERGIDAIIAYLVTIGADGEPIPEVDAAAGDLREGLNIYLGNCAGCHGAGATGDSVGGGQIAPSLEEPSATQIGEAIRVGPGVMPRFGPETIDDAELDSVAAYLLWLRDNGNEGGLPFGRVGAVVEGLVAGVFGLGILVLVIRLTGRSDVGTEPGAGNER